MLLAVLAVGGSASAATSSPARTVRQLFTLNREIASAINTYRLARGLEPVQVSSALNGSARQHSLEMGSRGYFDHPSADGTAYWKRIQHYYTDDSYSYWTVGENLVWSSPSISAADAMRMWIGSRAHRRNLRDPNWRELGVSSVHVVHAGGVYDGYDVTIITTDFGARHSE